MLNVTVVDAQGGGLGAAVVKRLADKFNGRIRLIALGTNAAATAAMSRQGADSCATGEAAICAGVREADVIVGGIGIIAASGMLGQITPRMARAVAESPAQKILIPMSKCNIVIPGAHAAIKDLIDAAATHIESLL